jgi:hypothetical protein
MNMHATIEVLPFLCNSEVNTPLQQRNCYKMVFSVEAAPSLCSEDLRPAEELELRESLKMAV